MIPGFIEVFISNGIHADEEITPMTIAVAHVLCFKNEEICIQGLGPLKVPDSYAEIAEKIKAAMAPTKDDYFFLDGWPGKKKSHRQK